MLYHEPTDLHLNTSVYRDFFDIKLFLEVFS